MNKSEAFKEINNLQDEYVDELIRLINSSDYDSMKAISFTSATGTGKTKMMSKLIDKLPSYYYIVTTLSKGQLHLQIKESLKNDCTNKKFDVYGCAEYRIDSKLQAEDIIRKIPPFTKCIWLRDEGHIKTNRFEELLSDYCYKVINFSATNTHSDIHCNFIQTMMLRTVNQTTGTPEEAIKKLLEIKEIHKDVQNYNPCAIFRCISGDSVLYERIIDMCEKNGLKHIDITDEEYTMAELCEDNNEYDVIINKFKLVEGIDIRRAHVLYMDSQPKNVTTTIQAIGRCRRNALLYREDIDILAPENDKLLKATRECYVYYNVEKMKITEDNTGELQYAFCNHISCEALKANSTINVINGQLSNGLNIIELTGETGRFDIIVDDKTGFNKVLPSTDFYNKEIKIVNSYLYSYHDKIEIENVSRLPLNKTRITYDPQTDRYIDQEVEPYYSLLPRQTINNIECEIADNALLTFKDLKKRYTKTFLKRKILKNCLLIIIDKAKVIEYKSDYLKGYIEKYLIEHKNIRQDYFFCNTISFLEKWSITLTSEKGQRQAFLRDYCDEYDFLLLKYFSIMWREHGIEESTITKQFERFIKLMQNPIISGKRRLFLFALYDEQNELYNKRIGYPVFSPLTVSSTTTKKAPKVKDKDIINYFDSIDNFFDGNQYIFLSFDGVFERLSKHLKSTEDNLKNCIVDAVNYSFDSLFEELNKTEMFLVKNGYYDHNSRITQEQLKRLQIRSKYIKFVNDEESAIIGVDLMKQIKIDDTVLWTESSAVSSKIESYNKLNLFLSNRYSNELEQAKAQYFKGKNQFDLDKKCNSLIGYCVEYYSKYLLYGETFLGHFIEQAQKEAKTNEVTECIVIRACMQKYKQLMIRSFGTGVAKIIKGIPVEQLIQEKYHYFVNLVVELGTKTANYVKKELYPDGVIADNYDPDLSIRHISGLADYITHDTILDVKVRNHIDESCVRQVLAYHYLSTKRSDLDIKRVIVYDAVSDRSLQISID